MDYTGLEMFLMFCWCIGNTLGMFVLINYIRVMNSRAILNLVPVFWMEHDKGTYYLYSDDHRFLLQDKSVDQVVERMWSEMKISSALFFLNDKLSLQYFGKRVETPENV